MSTSVEQERLVQPSAEPVDESSSITINDKKETSYSTFTPKADDENRNQTKEVKNDSDDEKDEETICCCANDCCCCDCWREYRFVVIVVVSLLICLAAPLYLLIRHAHFEFDYHKECVICFKGKQEFEVIFNQTSGECDVFSQNATYDSNDIVVDPNFCGAPHCQNLELLPGLRLVPYWAVALSAVLSIALSVGVNVIKYNCYLPIKRKTVRCIWGDETIEENPLLRFAGYDDVIRERANESMSEQELVNKELWRLRNVTAFLTTIGLTDPYLYISMYVYALFHFAMSIYEVTTNPTFADLNGWHKYQTVYGLFLNSGGIEVLWFPLSVGPLAFIHQQENRYSPDVLKRMLEKACIPDISEKLIDDAERYHLDLNSYVFVPVFQFEKYGEMIFDCLRSITICMTTPVIITHILPGVFLFIPYWSWIIVVLLAPLFVLWLVVDADHGTSLLLTTYAVFRLIGSFFVLLLFPILFNWTVLFYEGRTWSDVMTGEYRLRNTDCYFNALVNTIQIYNIGFVGLLFS